MSAVTYGWNGNPDFIHAVSAASTSYTIPAGKYGYVTFCVRTAGSYGSLDATQVVQTATNESVIASYWVPAGTVILNNGDTQYSVSVYS